MPAAAAGSTANEDLRVPQVNILPLGCAGYVVVDDVHMC